MASISNTIYELIKITIGDSVWSYTSTNENVEYDSITYIPEIIKIGNLVISDDFYKTNLTVNISSQNEFIRSFIAGSPDISVVIDIFRYTPETDSAITFFHGEIMSVTINEKTSKITCNQSSVRLSKQMMTNYFQKPCRHILYSKTGCRLNRNSYKIKGTILTMNGNVITMSGVTSNDSSYYLAGEIKTGLERKTITKYNPSTKAITLMRNLVKAKIGDAITIYAGCDHTKESCYAKNNILNFGGHSYIPEKNPLTKLV